jgi:hypothetical protein
VRSPKRIFSRAARAMISDGAITSGLALALLGDAYVARIRGLVMALCLLRASSSCRSRHRDRR